MSDAPHDRLAQLLRAGARFPDDAAVSAEDFVDANVDPPLTWGELRELLATRQALLAATDAATEHARQLAQHCPATTADMTAEAIRSLLRDRYGLPPALGASGTPLHLRDEYAAWFTPTAEEDALRRRFMIGGDRDPGDRGSK